MDYVLIIDRCKVVRCEHAVRGGTRWNVCSYFGVNVKEKRNGTCLKEVLKVREHRRVVYVQRY